MDVSEEADADPCRVPAEAPVGAPFPLISSHASPKFAMVRRIRNTTFTNRTSPDANTSQPACYTGSATIQAICRGGEIACKSES